MTPISCKFPLNSMSNYTLGEIIWFLESDGKTKAIIRCTDGLRKGDLFSCYLEHVKTIY